MKKLALIFALLVALPFAAFGDSWFIQKVDAVKDAVTGDEAKSAIKTDFSTSTDDERATWEISIRFPAFVYPAQGDRQTILSITDILLYHNMSKGFLSFWTQGKFISDISKSNKEGSYYDHSWDYKILAGGAQFYLTKQENFNFALFAGAAKVMANDGNGQEASLGVGEVWGFKFDIPYKADDPFGWNFEIVYEDMFAANKKNHITESLGDFGLRSWMLGIRVPF